jgi:hypothetical protein
MSTSPSQRLPLVGLPERRLPPVRLLPGQRPAQEASCPAVGNTVMSTPISARIVSAARLPTPVMVSSRSRAQANGASTRSMWASSSAIEASSCPRCATARRTSSAWWPPKRPRSPWPSWGSLARSRPLASSASTPGSRSPATSAASIARPQAPSTSVATESSLMPASSRVLLDALALRGVGLEPAACGSGPGSRSSRIGAGARSCPQQPVLQQPGPARRRRRRRSCGGVPPIPRRVAYLAPVGEARLPGVLPV